ncbi:MAG: DUF3500 domain-containing protein [Isosphaeraceae bacterium]|nr:DUF3500 domain-containing protein [Isosphaeraceae bacterium]
MHKIKPSLALAALGMIGLALWARAYVDRAGGTMATAAARFLAALDKDQAARAAFDFESPERTNWHFIPRERKGLPIKAMTPEQRALAFGLLQTGLSHAGALKATTIMSLEAILKEMEQGRGPVRDPENYYVSIFGTPSNRGRWGWRVEGHHLSLNFVIEDGRIVAATPAFFGANPAEVRQGPRQGLRTLADLEDRALRLLQALDDEQKQLAVVSAAAPREIRSADFKGHGGGLSAEPPRDDPKRIAAAKLTKDQRAMLQALIEAYAADMTPEIGAAWLDEIARSGSEGQDRIYFAWSGPADRNQPHAYIVQGPTFLIEFNNTQNNANHIHSVWRNRLGDFGLAAKN